MANEAQVVCKDRRYRSFLASISAAKHGFYNPYVRPNAKIGRNYCLRNEPNSSMEASGASERYA